MAKAKGTKEFEEIKLDPCHSSPTGFHHFMLPDSTGGYFQEVGVCKHCGDNKVHGKWGVGYNNQPEEVTKVRVVTDNAVPRLQVTGGSEFEKSSKGEFVLDPNAKGRHVPLHKVKEVDTFFNEGKHIVPTYLSHHGDTDDIEDTNERIYS